MRLTIDLDDRSYVKMAWTYFKMVFLVLYKKQRLVLPKVKRSSSGRGWHLVSSGLVTTIPEINRYRKWVGDDLNRILLDESSPVRVQQILFSGKEINYK